MRDVLAMVAEGSRRALRMWVEGQSTAGRIRDRLEHATEFDFLWPLSPYPSPCGRTARGQSSSGCRCCQIDIIPNGLRTELGSLTPLD
jgi:hypothetical protein